MGKVKIGIYCYLIADILTKVFRKYLLSGLLPNIYFFVQFDWLSWQSKTNFWEKIFKINSLEAMWKIKLKLCRNVHSTNLCKTIVVVCFYFGCYGNLKFSINL